MKDSHFQTGSPDNAFRGQTQHNSTFVPKETKVGGANYEGSMAY